MLAMAEPSKPPGWVPVLLWAVWLTLLCVWTVGLLIPEPHQALGVGHVDLDWRFIISKLSHLAVYTILAAFAGLLPVGRRGRVMIVALLLCHGAATEFLQQFVPTRTASLLDVGIDAVGTALGTAAAWAWRMRFSRGSTQ